MLVKGEVRERGGEPEMTVEEIVPMEKVSGNKLAGVELTLAAPVTTGAMLQLRNLLLEHPGAVPVTLCVRLADRTVSISAPESFKVDYKPALATAIEGLLGQGSIRERPAGA